MKIKTLILSALGLAGVFSPLGATEVTVKMNSTSQQMSLIEKASGEAVDVTAVEGQKYQYKFNTVGGDFVLTGYQPNGETLINNGTIEFSVSGDSIAQQVTVLTITAYATNKNWAYGEDYTIDLTVNSREGKTNTVTLGDSKTAGRKSFLAFNGNTYLAYFVPSAARQEEGYTTLFKSATLTGNVTASGAIPLGGDFTVSVPKDAGFELNMKTVHFADFIHIQPIEKTEKGNFTDYKYHLAQGQTYNYRTWMEGGITQAAQFNFAADESKRPVIALTEDDYHKYDPATINHDPHSNANYETGDIFMNVNHKGFMEMTVGEEFITHGMRTWQITDNSTNNYFFEPDFHYTVIDLDGKPCEDVVKVITKEPDTSAWATLKAVGQGTAIVLVTYDAIQANNWSNGTRADYLGGEFWGAIWPENTAAFVVSVDCPSAAITPNMIVNENYNLTTQKVAGLNVDAEHDTFYYLDTEEGVNFTFKPEGVAKVEIAYPVIGERMATYSGFTTEGVTANKDGSYSLLLKTGRHIVRMTDAAGNAAYQVLRGRECHREITNVSRPGSSIFQPGDQVKIQYSGLYHPANKMAGIYNMSAYITYNGVPNGTALILGAGQYNFAGVASAQAVTVDIPADHNIEAQPVIRMDEGVIQVNGFGDPIGAHRNTDPDAGRSPNFTAIAHKTYFGSLPDVEIPLTPYKEFRIRLNPNVENPDIRLYFNGQEVAADEDGMYAGTYGNYSIVASKAGYRCLRQEVNIPDEAEGIQSFDLELIADPASWDGITKTEPAELEGVYRIGNGAELAWFADYVLAGNGNANAALTADIELGDYDWTAIGNSSKKYLGSFDGAGHAVTGLYINLPDTQYQGLFGYVGGTDQNSIAEISNLSVSGKVSGKAYTGGIVGGGQYVRISGCVADVDVNTGNNAGGIIGFFSGDNTKNALCEIVNCANLGNVTGTGSAGGIAGAHAANSKITNVFNVGEITGNNIGGAVGSTTKKNYVANAYTTGSYVVKDGNTEVADEQMLSGEIAHLLGEAFGQTIGTHAYPVLGGEKVYKVTYELDMLEDELIEALSDDDAEADAALVLYSNATLPETLGENRVEWYADPERTVRVSTIDGDSKLYAKSFVVTGIDAVEAGDAEGDARWFNIQGVEVAAPEAGTHGLFIRLSGGKARKVVL